MTIVPTLINLKIILPVIQEMAVTYKGEWRIVCVKPQSPQRKLSFFSMDRVCATGGQVGVEAHAHNPPLPCEVTVSSFTMDT